MLQGNIPSDLPECVRQSINALEDRCKDFLIVAVIDDDVVFYMTNPTSGYGLAHKILHDIEYKWDVDSDKYN